MTGDVMVATLIQIVSGLLVAVGTGLAFGLGAGLIAGGLLGVVFTTAWEYAGPARGDR